MIVSDDVPNGINLLDATALIVPCRRSFFERAQGYGNAQLPRGTRRPAALWLLMLRDDDQGLERGNRDCTFLDLIASSSEVPFEGCLSSYPVCGDRTRRPDWSAQRLLEPSPREMEDFAHDDNASVTRLK